MPTEWSKELWRRVSVHAALADPGRLAAVDRLADGDASPSELQEMLGIPSNLMAHHLRILEEAGLIRRSKSEGDRRRTYISLIDGAGSGLADGPVRNVNRVVFVCTYNSARSQLATALWNRHSSVAVASAGTQPAERINPGAVAAARRRGLCLVDSAPVHMDEIVRPGDLIIAVCDNVHEHLDQGPRLHWSIPDPAREGTDEAFDTTIDELSRRIERIAARVRSA